MRAKKTGNWLSRSWKRKPWGVLIMAAYGKWIRKSSCIGASLGGVAGFFYSAYIMVTSSDLSWTDVPETIGSIAAVLIVAATIGSFCIAIGGLVGLVLGSISSPLTSFTEKR